MKILLVGDYPNDPRLGSPKVFYKLQEEYRKLGHSCDILLGDDLGRRPRNRFLRQALCPLLAARAIARHFRSRGPYDVVDIASAEGFIFGIQRRLGAYKNTVFVSRSNGLEHLNYRRMLDDHRHKLLKKPWYRRIWYPAARLTQVAGAARLADKLLLLNETDRAFAVAKGWKRSEDIHVISHGISDNFVGETNGSKRGRGILFCGTWENAKGVSYLVRAFTRLVDDGVKVNLSILGGGYSELAIRSAFPERVQDQIIVLPRANEEEVMRHYQSHDLLVFCSTYEGFGMVVIEAMAQRLPVVSTPVGCATRFVRDGETGIMIPPRDSETLAVAVRKLLDNPQQRHRIAENAFRQISKATWKNTAVDTVKIYSTAKAKGNEQ